MESSIPANPCSPSILIPSCPRNVFRETKGCSTGVSVSPLHIQLKTKELFNATCCSNRSMNNGEKNESYTSQPQSSAKTKRILLHVFFLASIKSIVFTQTHFHSSPLRNLQKYFYSTIYNVHQRAMVWKFEQTHFDTDPFSKAKVVLSMQNLSLPIR